MAIINYWYKHLKLGIAGNFPEPFYPSKLDYFLTLTYRTI